MKPRLWSIATLIVVALVFISCGDSGCYTYRNSDGSPESSYSAYADTALTQLVTTTAFDDFYVVKAYRPAVAYVSTIKRMVTSDCVITTSKQTCKIAESMVSGTIAINERSISQTDNYLTWALITPYTFVVKVRKGVVFYNTRWDNEPTDTNKRKPLTLEEVMDFAF